MKPIMTELDDRQLDQVSGGMIDWIPLPLPRFPPPWPPKWPSFPPLPWLEVK